jgi:hypothetical protein
MKRRRLVYFLHSDGVLGIQVEDLVYRTAHLRVYMIVRKI